MSKHHTHIVCILSANLCTLSDNLCHSQSTVHMCKHHTHIVCTLSALLTYFSCNFHKSPKIDQHYRVHVCMKVHNTALLSSPHQHTHTHKSMSISATSVQTHTCIRTHTFMSLFSLRYTSLLLLLTQVIRSEMPLVAWQATRKRTWKGMSAIVLAM